MRQDKLEHSKRSKDSLKKQFAICETYSRYYREYKKGDSFISPNFIAKILFLLLLQPQ